MTKEIKLDKKALEWACKQLMINSAKNDKVIKESTSLSEHVKFISWINELSYIQTLMLFFDNKYIKVNEQHVAEPQIRQKESKIKTALKYGLAGVAGGMVNNGTGLAAMLVYYFYRDQMIFVTINVKHQLIVRNANIFAELLQLIKF